MSNGRLVGAVAAGVLVVTLAAACSSGGGSSSSASAAGSTSSASTASTPQAAPSGGSAPAGVAQAQKQLAAYENPNPTISLPALSAKPPAGKTIDFVGCPLASCLEIQQTRPGGGQGGRLDRARLQRRPDAGELRLGDE